MFNDTPNENDHETNGHQTITYSVHSNSSPNHDDHDDQLEIEESRGLIGQAISSAFSSIVGALSGKKSRQRSEIFESENIEPVNISPESKKSDHESPVMETVMEAVEKEEYAVQEFVPETIVVTETPENEHHEEEVVQHEEQEHVEVHDHPNAIEVEDDNDEVKEQSEYVEDVGMTEITIRYQEIVDENSRANVGFDEEKVEEKQAIVEVHEDEERGSHDVEVLEQPVEFRQEMESENVPVRHEEENHEQDVIIEEKMEVEAQPEPEPEVHREEEPAQQYEEKASSHNTEPVVTESPNELERKTESPVRQDEQIQQRQEIAIDLVQESHEVPHEPMLTDMNTLEGEEISAALDKEDKLHIVGNIIEVSSEEPSHSQEREHLEVENQPMPVENEKLNNESMDRLCLSSPKGLNHTNEDVLLDTSHHSNQQMLIENCENEDIVVPVLEYIEEDHNENDITRIEEPDEIMIEVQDPIEECPESQEMTSILPMMEINTESIIVRNIPQQQEIKEKVEAKKTDNHTNNTPNLKKNEPKRGTIVPPTRITNSRNTSLAPKKPFSEIKAPSSEIKARGIQSAVPKTTTNTQIKPKFPPEFAALTAQRKPVVGLNNKPVVKNAQQITPKRDNSSNKNTMNIPNIPAQRKPLVTQQQNTVNNKKRKAEEIWTKGTADLKQVKKNNQVPTAKEKEKVNIMPIRNPVNTMGTMKPPQNRTPRVSVDKNSSHKETEPSNENEQQSEIHKSGNKPACVVCSGVIESRTDSQMLSCLHKIHKRCYLVMEKKKSQCPACNSNTMNRIGFQPGMNTTPNSKRQEKKLVY